MELSDLVPLGLSPEQAFAQRRAKLVAAMLRGEPQAESTWSPGVALRDGSEKIDPNTLQFASGAISPPVPGAKMPTHAPPGASAEGEGAPPKEVWPHRVQIGDKAFTRGLASEYVDPAIKQALFTMYMQQGQPMELAGPLGSKYLVGGGKIHHLPNSIENEVSSPGGGKTKEFYQPTPGGKLRPTEFEGLSGAPPQTPNIDGFAPPSIAPRSSPQANSYAPEEAGGGVATALRNAAPTAEKLAQNNPYTARTMDSLDERGLRYENRKKLIDKDVEELHKSASAYQQIGIKASAASSDLKLGKKLIEDPNFFSGPLLGAKQFLASGKYILGMNDHALEANQAFDKIISSSIIDDLKLRLQGTGQVRVAEIDLLRKAAANASNTPGANRLLLEMAMRAHDMAATIGSISTAYMKGYRYDKDGNPRMTNELPTHAGLEGTVRQYVDNNPLIPEGELENYKKFFESQDINKDKTSPPKKGTPTKRTIPPTEAPKVLTAPAGGGHPPNLVPLPSR